MNVTRFAICAKRKYEKLTAMWDILAPLIITTHSLSNNEHHIPQNRSTKKIKITLKITLLLDIAYLISSSVIICVYNNDTAEKRKLIVQKHKRKKFFIVLLEKCDSTHSSLNIYFFYNFLSRRFTTYIRSLLGKCWEVQSNFKKISQRIKF